MKLNSTSKWVISAFALGIITLAAGSVQAYDSSDSDTDSAEEGVDYRAPGVSFKQFGSAAQQLVEHEGSADTQWVFTRAFAWAAYEYAYNRPNYDRWVAQLGDARLQELMQVRVARYVAAGRPPLANPMPAADHAVATWTYYHQISMVAAK